MHGRLRKPLQQGGLSCSLALRTFTFKPVIVKEQLVDSCEWAEELEGPDGTIARQVYGRDPPACALDAGPGVMFAVAIQREATGIVAQPQRRAGIGSTARCLRRDAQTLGAQHVAEALQVSFFSADDSL